MTNYRATYATMANRAIAQGEANLEAFIAQMIDTGVDAAVIEDLLLDDLANDGPIFGSFFRSLQGAGERAVDTAHRQGNRLAQAETLAQTDRELKRLLQIAGGEGSAIQTALDGADPELLEEIEQASGEGLELTWVATLVNTCHRCLPLHGKTRTAEEWQSAGLHPSTIHSGWASSCHCQLKTSEELGGKPTRGELIDPLKRLAKRPEGSRSSISKKTVRAVTQADLEKARNMVAKIQGDANDIEGRRAIRRAGQANRPGADKEAKKKQT